MHLHDLNVTWIYMEHDLNEFVFFMERIVKL